MGLENGQYPWDDPRMKLVSDDRCRVQSRDLFKPNTPYDAEAQPDGSVRLVELVEKDVPFVKPRRVHGRLRGAGMNPSRERVAAAIRSDRDAR